MQLIKDEPKPKCSRVFRTKDHSIVSKAFSKSAERSNPGIPFECVYEITLLIKQMFSTIEWPFKKPVRSYSIRSDNTDLRREAIAFVL